MKLKKILVFLSALFIYSYIHSYDITEKNTHRNILSEYFKLKSSAQCSDKLALQNLFEKAIEIDPKYLQRLKKDIAQLNKIIKLKKKKKEDINTESSLLTDLQELYNFFKKHHLQIDIIAFHQAVKKDWSDLIDLVDKHEDILPKLPSKGITKEGVKALKELINKINKLLRITEQYETRLHTDWIDLKLTNYVMKIELIRLRNAAIFHPLYRGMPIVTNYPR